MGGAPLGRVNQGAWVLLDSVTHYQRQGALNPEGHPPIDRGRCNTRLRIDASNVSVEIGNNLLASRVSAGETIAANARVLKRFV